MRQTGVRFKAPHARRCAGGSAGGAVIGWPSMPSLQRHVFVCINERPPGHPKGCCKARGGVEVRDRLKEVLAARGLAKRIRANNAGCLDQCEHGVTVVVYPEQVWYGHVTPADIEEIVEKHLIGGEVVTRLLLPDQPHLAGRAGFPGVEIER
jgi:(2Fe-2S) ferredoxin